MWMCEPLNLFELLQLVYFVRSFLRTFVFSSFWFLKGLRIESTSKPTNANWKIESSERFVWTVKSFELIFRSLAQNNLRSLPSEIGTIQNLLFFVCLILSKLWMRQLCELLGCEIPLWNFVECLECEPSNFNFVWICFDPGLPTLPLLSVNLSLIFEDVCESFVIISNFCELFVEFQFLWTVSWINCRIPQFFGQFALIIILIFQVPRKQQSYICSHTSRPIELLEDLTSTIQLYTVSPNSNWPAFSVVAIVCCCNKPFGSLCRAVSSNNITVLPTHIGTMTSLQQLCVSLLHWLTKRYFCHNNISVIPPQIGQVSTLLVLYFRFINTIHVIREGRGNKLTSLPKQLYNVTGLRHLLLDRNAISGTLPTQFLKLDNLGYLSVICCRSLMS